LTGLPTPGIRGIDSVGMANDGTEMEGTDKNGCLMVVAGIVCAYEVVDGMSALWEEAGSE